MIVFDDAAIAKYQELSNQVLRSGFLSEGEMTKRFEKNWQDYCGMPASAVSSGGMALWVLCEAANLRGYDVIVPTNTFMASALAVEKAGGRVVWADCSRKDLCLSLESIQAALTPKTKAVMLVHIGGHLAFEIEKIAEFCKAKELTLIEDCAHAHGATLNGKMGGSWGLGGAYSFYATKTMPVGEGGMVVSNDAKIIDYCNSFRSYGKFEYKIQGFHGRMSELTAALGIVQLERLPKIVKWKQELAKKFDQIFENRVHLPKNMTSGFYKYIVFDAALKEKTGTVYTDLCHTLRGSKESFPHSEWVAKHHACPPIWYGWPGAELTPAAIKEKLLG